MKHTKAQFVVAAGLVAGIIGLFGCKPTMVSKGNLVSLNYTLIVDSNVVDTSTGRKPLEFVQGSGQIIPGLDEALLGMKVGEKKHVVISPEKGYGLQNPKAIQQVPLSAFGDTKGLKPGMMVHGSNQGHPVQAKVVSIDKKTITLDMNHPLAGKTLNFDIEIVAIDKAPKASTVPSK